MARPNSEKRKGACGHCGARDPDVEAALIHRPGRPDVWCCMRYECEAFLLWDDDRWFCHARVAHALAHALDTGPIHGRPVRDPDNPERTIPGPPLQLSYVDRRAIDLWPQPPGRDDPLPSRRR